MRRDVVVGALGTAQTLAWASSYFLPAILADPIAQGLGLSRSAALRAIGPITATSPRSGIGIGSGPAPRNGIRSRLGLCEKTPQKCAGQRNDPPMSAPSSKGT